jgi:hypothetical protein
MEFKLGLSTQLVIMHLGLMALGAFLFVFARRLHNLFYAEKSGEIKLLAIRFLVGLFISLQVLDIIFYQTIKNYNNVFFKSGLSIATIFLSLEISNFIAALMRRRFGKKKDVDDNRRYQDTYNSRLATIGSYVGLIFIVTYLFIKIWGLDSLLQTTGFFGLVFGFIVLTNAIWAPDLYYGLVILNSEMIGDGETICMNNELYIINRVTFVFTSLLNISQNNRTLIRNSQLVAHKIDNLTRRGSTDGIRQQLVYKMGYPELIPLGPRDRKEALEAFIQRVDKMFAAVAEEAAQNADIEINRNRPFEWFLTQTGDYALEFTLFYFLKPLPVTHITKDVRRHVIGTKNAINMLVYRHSIHRGVDLATPMVISHATVPPDIHPNRLEDGKTPAAKES